MTSILLYKGIRDDQSKERQLMAGRFYTDDRETAKKYGSIIETNVVEFQNLYVTTIPIHLAKSWSLNAAIIAHYCHRRSHLMTLSSAYLMGINEYKHVPRTIVRWCETQDYYLVSFLLDRLLAEAARERGYDGIHYRGWGIYAKL